jgi:HSP90 family molecular chaperone
LIEKLLAKDYEVIVMTDPIDEWSLQNVERFDNKYPLVNVAKEGFKIEGDDEVDKVKAKEIASEYRPLISFLKKSLKGKIAKVTISQNLVKTPTAISSGSFGFTANMERLMKAQSYNDKKQLAYMKSQRILEINPTHPLVKELNRRVIANKQDPIATDIAELLYETASLQSGFTIENPTDFSGRILRMIKHSLQLEFEEGIDEHILEETTKETTEKDVEEALKKAVEVESTESEKIESDEL